jgi:hypothetical protein
MLAISVQQLYAGMASSRFPLIAMRNVVLLVWNRLSSRLFHSVGSEYSGDF